MNYNIYLLSNYGYVLYIRDSYYTLVNAYYSLSYSAGFILHNDTDYISKIKEYFSV